MDNRSDNLLEPRNALLVAFMMLVQFASWGPLVLIMPFLPEHLESDLGEPPLLTGIMFALFPFCMMISSTPFGYAAERLGRIHVLISGVTLLGLATILFGRFPDSIVAMLILRSVQGVGSGAAASSAYALIPLWFPRRNSVVVGWSEGAVGMSFAAAPAVGGLLYVHGGHTAPFDVFGGMVLVFIPFTLGARYLAGKGSHKADVGREDNPNLCQICNVDIAVMFISVVLINSALAMIEPTLEEHMHNKFGADEETTGLVYAIWAGSYIIAAPGAGRLSEAWGNLNTQCLGLVFGVLCWTLLGPAPFLSSFIESNKILHWASLILSLFLMAMAFSCVFIPSMPHMILSVEHLGEDRGKAVVPGIFNTATSCGIMTGNLSGAYFVGEFGFSWTTFGFAILLLLYLPCVLLLRKYSRFTHVRTASQIKNPSHYDYREMAKSSSSDTCELEAVHTADMRNM